MRQLAGKKVVFCICFIIFMLSGCSFNKQDQEKTINQEKAAESELPMEDGVSETAAGFYMYDSQNQPIYRDQDITTVNNVELNIVFSNICSVELRYSAVILVNDYIQNAVYTIGDKKSKDYRNGTLGAGKSETVNVKFKIRGEKRKSNEIRVVMLYYPDKVPTDNLDQVMVADTVEIHTLICKKPFERVKENKLEDIERHTISDSGMENGIWLTSEKCKQIPKFNFLIPLSSENKIYFNTIGNSGKYFGIVFLDGVPQKVGVDYLFCWKQKKNVLSAVEFDRDFTSKQTVFAYMYEQGSSFEDTYVTALYYME